jgi:putative addiction module component (TIGR02574 family)
MTDYSAVLTAAQQLPEEERLRLIDALWETVSPDSEADFTDAWAQEIKLRVAQLDAGTVTTIPWSEIRDDALARLSHAEES